jgi:MscS family membrane protein
MQTLGYSISGVLAFGGIGGIAIGFAAKDLLANFFGGMMIFLDRPFSVGDWIRSPEKEIEGTVEHIGWRLTRIRTFDKRPLYIPNSVFASIVVENPSRMTNRRIYETIGIRYDDAAVAADVIAAVREMLQNHPDIDHNQTLMVNFNKFGASSLDFFIYTFTKTTVWTQFHEVKQDVLFKIQDIIEAHGAEIAFPTSTVHLPDQLKVIQANAEGLQSS